MTDADQWRPEDEPAPRSESMPDLGYLPAKTLRLTLAAFAITGAVPITERPASDYLFNLVRLSEKSLSEYVAARQAIAAYEKSASHVSGLMECIDHLETCVNATHRGYLFARALRGAELSDHSAAMTDEVKLQLRAIGPTVDALRDVRDNVEHRDDDLRGDRPIPDAAFLAPGAERVFVGDKSITYVDLGRLVRRLFDIAAAVLGVPNEWGDG